MPEYTLKELFVPATVPPVHTVGAVLMQPQLKRGKSTVLYARKHTEMQPEPTQSFSSLSSSSCMLLMLGLSACGPFELNTSCSAAFQNTPSIG